MLSKFEPMRVITILTSLIAATIVPISAATPEAAPTPTVPAAAAEQGKDVVHALNNAFAKVFEIVAPSVVIIEVSKKSDGAETSAFDDLFFQGPPDENNPRRNPRGFQPIQSEGSGFIVRPDGYIFTNFHVVEGADKIEVKLKDGREFSARVMGTDEKTDIAVIKIDAKDLPVVQLGDSDAVRVGQFAFAIGAPFKLDYTFTYGVVSGKGRNKLLATGGYSISDYLQTDASINPGNSGGPLCDIAVSGSPSRLTWRKKSGTNSLPAARLCGRGLESESNRSAMIQPFVICSKASIKAWSCARLKPTRPLTKVIYGLAMSSRRSMARPSAPTPNCNMRS